MAKKRWNKNEKERAGLHEASAWIYGLSGDELKGDRVVEHVGKLKIEIREYGKEWQVERAKKTNEGNERAAVIEHERIMPIEGVLRHIDPWRELCGLKIRNKDGDKCGFKPYVYQKEVYDYIESHKDDNEGCVIQILKSRKLGFSTLVAAMFYRDTKRQPGTERMIVGESIGGAANIFGIYEYFYNNDPYMTVGYEGGVLEREGNVTRPQGSRLIEWIDRAQGRIDVLTAASPESSRGGTKQGIHSSECCSYPQGSAALEAIMGTIGVGKNKVIVFESTGQSGTMFEDMWRDDTNGIHKYFFPWFKDPGCCIEFKTEEDKLRFEKGMSRYEREMMYDFHLQLEQLHFWKIKLTRHFNNNMYSMLQEFPARPEEAFQSTSRALFAMGSIKHYCDMADAREKEDEESKITNEGIEPNIGDLNGRIGSYMINGTHLIARDDEPVLKVYEEPLAGVSYVIGADVADGRIIGDGAKKSAGMKNVTTDYSTMVVMRGFAGRLLPAVVATYNARSSNEEFVSHLDTVGSLYNTALINVESNRNGFHVISTLKNVNGYPNIARRMILTSGGKARRPTLGRTEYGYETGDKTRDILFKEIISTVELKTMVIPCKRLISQLESLKLDDDGKPKAAYGRHDDLVIAFGIALFTLIYITLYPPARRTPINTVAFFDNTPEKSIYGAVNINRNRVKTVESYLIENFKKQGIPQELIGDFVRLAIENDEFNVPGEKPIQIM